MDEEERNREAYLQIVERIATIEGRFANIRRLGALGGGGVWSLIFQAEDVVSGATVLSATVAIKVYSPHKRSDQYRLESFRRRGRLLQELGQQKDIIGLFRPSRSWSMRLNCPAVFRMRSGSHTTLSNWLSRMLLQL